MNGLKELGIKGILLDYGGTIDTAGVHWFRMLYEAYVHCSINIDRAVFYEIYVVVERLFGNETIIKEDDTFYTTLEKKIDFELKEIIKRDIFTFSQSELGSIKQNILIYLYEQVKKNVTHSLSVLEQLKKDYPLVLVSNFYGNLNTVLNEFKFNDLFVSVIESAKVGIRKPDSAIYSLGIKKIGLKPNEILVVGDSYKNDIAPAKELGCNTAWITPDELTKEQLASTTMVIRDLNELLTNEKRKNL